MQPAATTVPTAAETPGPFHPFAKGSSLRVWRLGTGVLVTSEEDGHAIAELRGDTLVQDPALARGVVSCWNQDVLLFGGWPESAWMVRGWVPWAVRAPVGTLHRWKRGAWTKVSAVNVHQLLIAPVPGEGTLSLEVPRRTGPPWGYRLRALDGPNPRLFPSAAKDKPFGPDDRVCYTRLEEPLALIAFSRRDVVVLGGSECVHDPDATPSAMVAERWSGGRPQFESLPVRPGPDRPIALHAAGSDDIWVTGLALDEGRGEFVMAHWDGRRWAVEGGALPGAVRAMGRDGDVFYLVAGEMGASGVWRGTPLGGWERVGLPDGAGAPTDVFVRAAGEVWVVTEDGIFRTRPTERVFEWAPQECRGDEGEIPTATEPMHRGDLEF